MELTERRALTESIKIWKKLAANGKDKWWYSRNVERIYKKYPSGCPLCKKYLIEDHGCLGCPLFRNKHQCEYEGQPYSKWRYCCTDHQRKIYAKQILTILQKALQKLDAKKRK